MSKPKCMITVDVEALKSRADGDYVDTLIYGRVNGGEYGIGRLMDIADRHGVKMSFFVDFAECELYGDEILDVARYIKGRGHDLQVHCHCELLKDYIGEDYLKEIGNGSYTKWCENEQISKIVVSYVTEKYKCCTGETPLAYRAGAYRVGEGLIKALKSAGYIADLSFNCLRPLILPKTKQFKFENGITEFPITVSEKCKPLNFNYPDFTPKTRCEFDSIIDEYTEYLHSFCGYYGDEAIATLMMHSWSLMFCNEKFGRGSHFDCPNELMVEFYDYFLERMKDKADFITVTDGIELAKKQNVKTVEFDSFFSAPSPLSDENLCKIEGFVNSKVNGRQFVVWGKGWMESAIFQKYKLNENPNMAFYLSNDADTVPMWRKKPVYKFGEVELTPKKYFVLVVAQPSFSEIRDSLKELGFKKYEDYYDVSEFLPAETAGRGGVETE